MLIRMERRVRQGLKSNNYKHILIGIVIIGILVVYAPGLEAFTVSPGMQEIRISAGSSYKGSFSVGNPSTDTIKIKATAEDWSVETDERMIDRTESSALDWFTIGPQEIEIGPHKSGIFTYNVTLPEEAEGEYVAMIYFSTVPVIAEEAVTVVSRIGNALYVIVKGTEIIEGELIDIKVTRTDPMNVRVTIENSGNVHIRPKGEITIRKKGLFLSSEEKEPVIIPFNKAGFPVLPKQNYIFEERSKGVKFGLGWYSLEFEAEFDGNKLRKEVKFKVERGGGVKTFPADK